MYAECRHIMPSGVKCHAPALSGKYFCFYHVSLRRARDPKPAASEPFQLPPIEDASGVQLALMQVLQALASGRLDRRQAGLFLYGIQIAAQLATHRAAHEPREIVRSATEEPDGELLAPEQQTCEPLADCDSCPSKDTCISLDRVNLRSRQRLVNRWRKAQDAWAQKDAEREEKEKNPEMSLADQWLLEVAEEEIARATEKQHDEIDSIISSIKQDGIFYVPENLSPALRARFEQEGIKPTRDIDD